MYVNQTCVSESRGALSHKGDNGEMILIAPGCKGVHTDLPRQFLLPIELALFDTDSHRLNEEKETPFQTWKKDSLGYYRLEWKPAPKP